MIPMKRAKEILSVYTDEQILCDTTRTTDDEQERIGRQDSAILQLQREGFSYREAAHAVTLALRERRK